MPSIDESAVQRVIKAFNDQVRSLALGKDYPTKFKWGSLLHRMFDILN